MKQAYTAEEVNDIEEKAYRFGIVVGEHTERHRIIELITSMENSSVGTESLGCLAWTQNIVKIINDNVE